MLQAQACRSHPLATTFSLPLMEFEFIHWLRERLPAHPQLLLGAGDDAALVRWTNHAHGVITADLLADGVHFQLDQCGARLAGRKALAVNLSDLAAMAARPVAATVSLLLPRAGGESVARELVEGMLPLCEQFGVAIAGGDTNSWSGRLVVSVTAIGETTEHGPWRRDGARPGDRIVVTGDFGGSIRDRHLQFSPRVAEALSLNANYLAHAAIDVSDGLSLDLSRVAQASNCGAVLDIDRIPIAESARNAASGRDAAIAAALSDGEDFELLLAMPPDEADRLVADQPLDVPLTCIGSFVEELGLWSATAGGRQPLSPAGYEHSFEP